MTILLLLVGLGLVVLGADWLVDGASSIARRAGVGEFVIGLTIVGFGTSCPELVVSLSGATAGNADVAVGNVVGSNIFNVLFILGLTSVLHPVGMTAENRKRDIPLTLAVTLLLLVLSMNHTLLGIGPEDGLSRIDGALLLLIFILYVLHSFREGKSSSGEPLPPKEGQRPLLLSVLLVVAGLAGLVGGGDLFVDKATVLAGELGVSDKFIAVTILAGGTSLPELATSIVAVLRGRNLLALGNILGSNVFNILLILGSSALITPLSFGNVTIVDALALALSMLMLLVWAYTGKRQCVDRWEGAVMLLAFGAYYYYLFINA